MKLPLSVLDLAQVVSGSTAAQALQDTLELGRLADLLGYERFWLAEHHNMPSIASSAPEIMISQVARETSRIRVGSGGIMLPNHAPLKVAEWFRTLEALFPGRIDLGIGRAPGTDQLTARALRGARGSLGAEDFPAQLSDLINFTTGNFAPNHPFRSLIAMPDGVPLPPIWLLGSSDYSAHLAARLGMPFGFAAHFSTHEAEQAMLAYRMRFQPSEFLAEPKALLTVAAICAETDEEADYLAKSTELFWVRFHRGEIGPLPSPEEAAAYPYHEMEMQIIRARRGMTFIGSPERVKAGIMGLAERTRADEVMITTMVHSPQARMRSYELLAEAFELNRGRR